MAEEHFWQFLEEKIPGCKYFKWKEALLLREWDIYALPDEDVAKNIIDMAEVMDQIRILFGKPIVITSWYRPPKYNDDIGGSFKSYAGSCMRLYSQGLSIGCSKRDSFRVFR
jgi:hypothetical protein